MINILLKLRFVIALASIGVIAAAGLMFWEGLLTLWHAYAYVRTDPDLATIAAVMRGTDKLLFAIVLVIFACAITLGFLVELSPERRAALPEWMIIDSVAELKNLFIQMIILYLVVHFATLVAETDQMLEWNALVLPISVLLLAAAMKLIAATHRRAGPEEPPSAQK
ncbi:YqhA family protein [Rhizobium jaguaris]|uniref:YqhA family protein n=1 Tax=Rhizobium jaguaris TaxID=1312183 RepID=A0A387FY29_9HYPH|nr:YqhA family protein [Rhizobium jaguaris]AYG62637.1 YqhA family protein [Rhizobium jaguaris]